MKSYLQKDKKIYFETIKCKDYEIFNLKYHNKRISNTIGLNIELREYIYPPNGKLLRCKLIYDENGILDIEYFEYKERNFEIFKVIVDDNIDYKYKYLNRFHIEQLYSKKGIADDIIIIKNGLITDTSIANIAILKDEKWITPKKPLLYGTTRDKLIEKNYIKEEDINLQDLKNSKKIAIMNAMIGFKELKNIQIIY